MRLEKFSVLTSLGMVFPILFGYVNYIVSQGGDAWPIPAISVTWTFRPANWVSRVFVIGTSANMVILCIGVYLGSKEKSKFLLAMAVYSTFCLACISAFCMDEMSTECLGNEFVHVDAAVTYFVLLDVWMLIMYQTELKSGLTWMKLVQTGMLACSVSGKVLMVAYGEVGEDLPWWLGSFEWFNTGVALSFIMTLIQDQQASLHVGIVDKQQAKPPSRLLFEASNRDLTFLSAMICVLTLSLCFVLMLAFGDIPPHAGYIPQLSDLFVLFPSNGVGRIGGVWGSMLLAYVLTQHYCVYRELIPMSGTVAWLISLLSALLLAICLSVSKLENSFVHNVSTLMFFLAFQVFSTWFAQYLTSSQYHPLRVIAYLSLVSKCRFMVLVVTDDLFAVLEMMDSALILLFICGMYWNQSQAVQSYPLAVYEIEDGGTEHQPFVYQQIETF